MSAEELRKQLLDNLFARMEKEKQEQDQRNHDRLNKQRWDDAHRLLSFLANEDLSGLHVASPKTQLKNYGGRGIKSAGGKGPMDYAAVESMVTLRDELNRPFDQADHKLILKEMMLLKRMVNY